MVKENLVSNLRNIGRGVDVVTIGATAMVPGLGQYHMAAVTAALAGEVLWGVWEGGKSTFSGAMGGGKKS